MALDYEEFQLDTNSDLLDDIEVELYVPVIQNGTISIDEMKKVGSDLEQYIRKVVTYA